MFFSIKKTWILEIRIELIVASPSWKEEPFDVETSVGEKVSMKCSASGYPNPKIEWIKKDDVAFFPRRDPPTPINSTLHFNSIRITDDGEYICIASNGIGEPLEKKITILIHESPKIQHAHVPSQVEFGEKINILCMTRKGSPSIQFEWYKDSVVHKSRENIQIVDTNYSLRFTLDPVTHNSSGKYTFYVCTEYG
ncbi:peroxidasin-like protein [Nephila pilipes]|uniref:Peroxidasin-like protein n=1 Tax=Nephila pilipes TaxID=299642 RepID=A0A8X6PZD6_NEPPI|nr:peroxidasin-like protein [Nephila pilipes]